MWHIHLNTYLEEKAYRELLVFLGNISDKMSIARYYNGKLTREEFDNIQREFYNILIEEDRKRQLNYAKNLNGYRKFVGQKAEEYFNQIRKQDMSMYNNLKYEDFENSKYDRYSPNTPDYLYTKFTRQSPVTTGSVFEICYFSIGSTFKDYVSSLCFLIPSNSEEDQFEDLAFYKGERIVFADCVHEGFSYLNLEDEEYYKLMEIDALRKIVMEN